MIVVAWFGELWAVAAPVLHATGCFVLVVVAWYYLGWSVFGAVCGAFAVGVAKELLVDVLLRGHCVGLDDLLFDAVGVVLAGFVISLVEASDW